MKSSKEAIVNVAIKVFGRLGFYKTTMADIARAANKGRRTIYQYFKNKEEIYDAVIEKETANLITGLDEVAYSDLEPTQKLRNYLFERMKTIYNLSINYQAFKMGLLSKHRVVDKLRIKFDQNDTKLIRYILNEGNESGDFKIQTIELTTNNIIATLKGLEISFIKKNFNQKCIEQLNEFVNLLFTGISTSNRVSLT